MQQKTLSHPAECIAVVTNKSRSLILGLGRILLEKRADGDPCRAAIQTLGLVKEYTII
jgi:hypothetical protein